MPSVPRFGDLQIDQHLPFQRREWIFERICWIGMAVLILAALLGLLGDGPLSDRVAASDDGTIKIEYQRFLNYRNGTRLTVHVSGAITSTGTFRLAINQEYLNNAELIRITPSPEHTEAGSDRLAFVFRVTDPGRPAIVVFDIEPFNRGSLHGEVVVNGRPTAVFDQWVHP